MRDLHAPIIGSFSFRHADGVRKPILTLGLLVQPAAQKESTLCRISVSCSWLILLEDILGGSGSSCYFCRKDNRSVYPITWMTGMDP
jgi:hypothetical protein